jgi:hypothetical protein
MVDRYRTDNMNRHTMAVVRANYTRSSGLAKANIRYIQHRRGKDGKKIKRELYGIDGVMERVQAYEMIDEAEEGTTFFRLKISPDPAKEDTNKDLHLQEITTHTMLQLEERLGKPVPYIAADHDHTDVRHVHVLACVQGRVNPPDLEALRATATQTALEQRKERDMAREQQQQRQEGLQRGAQR